MPRTPLLVSAVFAACVAAAAAGGEQAADPYVVTIDLRPWIEQLRSDDLFEIDPAIESLGALGDHAVPALHAALGNEGKQARLNIVEILRDIRTPATAAPLVEAATDPDEEVSIAAIEALGRLGDERATPVVEAALLGDSPRAVRAAATACRALCSSPAALRRLVELSLAADTASFARPSLRAAAGDQRSAQVRALVDEIAVPAMREGPPAQRFAAALVLADAGNRAAVAPLSECATTSTDGGQVALALQCVQALGRSRTEDAVAPLVEVAGGNDRTLRPAACAALGAFVQTSQQARDAYAACARNQPAAGAR